MDKPKGERMTAPVAFSRTETRYRMGDAQIEVKIVDSAFQQMLVAPWAMFLAAGYEKKADDGREKLTGIKQLQDFAGQVDFNKLAGLGK